jgi:hypothetical protein
LLPYPGGISKGIIWLVAATSRRGRGRLWEPPARLQLVARTARRGGEPARGRLAEAEGRQTCAVSRLGEAAAGLARVRRARRRERRLASFFCVVYVGARDSIERPLLYRLRFMCG